MARARPPRDGGSKVVGCAKKGGDALTARATELAAAGDLRLACQVVELAVQADPESTTAHGARAEIYQQRRNEEFSLMSKGIFAAAARESRAIADQ